MDRKLLASPDTVLRDGLKQLDKGGAGSLFVVDASDKLIGIVTDGDIRRGLLRNIDLTSPLSEVMNRSFQFWPKNKSREEGVLFLKNIKRRQLPIVDEDMKLVDLILLDELEFKKLPNPVVFMAGGLGNRMYPLTQDIPKPMLHVGGRPMMEIMVERFANQGFNQFHFCVNYKADYIENHFAKGDKWGVAINYVREEKKLGTAGALGLLKKELDLPFVVINADVLTNINLSKLVSYHSEKSAAATVCVSWYNIEIPYGVVEIENDQVRKIVEKPNQRFPINSGIYVLNPDVLEWVPENEPFDMPNLLRKLIEKGQAVHSFPIHEYWSDIGTLSDYERTNHDYERRDS